MLTKVSNFRTSDGTLIDALIGIRCKFEEYNCAVKMIGRLEPVVQTIQGEPIYAHSDPEAFVKHKAEVIKEFGRWLDSKESLNALNSGGGKVFFPNDGGKYFANMYLYADRCYVPAPENYWKHFPSLIRELETTPEYGFQVFQMPVFANVTWGGCVPSSVWGIVSPGRTKDLLLPGSETLQKNAATIKANKSPWVEQLKKAI